VKSKSSKLFPEVQYFKFFMLKIRVGAGAVGAGAASRYGSDSGFTKLMFLWLWFRNTGQKYRDPALTQHFENIFSE
jgi:hypothetical protein